MPQGNGLAGVASNGTNAWGVFGYSDAGMGVRGNSTSGTGVYGLSTGGDGVHGQSTGGDGVSGTAAASNKSGVFGLNSGSGPGVAGRSTSGFGMEAAGGGDAPSYDQIGDLVLGGEIGEIFHFGPQFMNLFSNGSVLVDIDNDNNESKVFMVLNGTDDQVFSVDENGNLFAAGSKGGYVVDIAQNDDTVPLEAGDVVVISGAGPAVMGEIPVIQVRLATAGAASGVVGVVDKHYVPAPARAAESADRKAVSASVDEAAIAPGQYLTVVTHGSFKAVKVDASYGAIAPGDLLVASPKPGYAMRATDPRPGTIIGKALAALPSGSGVIAVIVTLQ
jgi:hypothetical protein